MSRQWIFEKRLQKQMREQRSCPWAHNHLTTRTRQVKNPVVIQPKYNIKSLAERPSLHNSSNYCHYIKESHTYIKLAQIRSWATSGLTNCTFGRGPRAVWEGCCSRPQCPRPVPLALTSTHRILFTVNTHNSMPEGIFWITRAWSTCAQNKSEVPKSQCPRISPQPVMNREPVYKYPRFPISWLDNSKVCCTLFPAGVHWEWALDPHSSKRLLSFLWLTSPLLLGFQNHLLNKLFALESLFRGLLWGDPNRGRCVWWAKDK